MQWIITQEIPNNVFGFVYIIVNLLTDKFYIGKKQMFSKRKVKISKREKKKTGTRKTFKIVIKEMNWKDYTGSNIELNNDIETLGEINFAKRILSFQTSKKRLTYAEIKEQMCRDVLIMNSYNSNIAGKYFRKDLI